MNLEAKLKHLEFIQNTITRMAHNSFLLKGWAITLLGALIGLNKDDIDLRIIVIAIFLIIMFWALDAYFLAQERYFRARYDQVRVKEPDEIDFSMKLEGKSGSEINWFVTFTSVTLWLYYLSLLGVMVLFGMFM